MTDTATAGDSPAPPLFNGGVMLHAPIDQRTVLGRVIGDMVPSAWAAKIAHAFSMLGQTHGLLVHLGWRRIRNVATGDVGADVTTLDRLIVDLAHFDLSK